MSLVKMPPQLERAIEEHLASVDRRELERAAGQLSERYRDPHATRFVRGSADALAYLAQVMPAAHAQMIGALNMVPLRVGEWKPRRFLDLGSGPGTALWAATAIWPEIAEIVAIEREEAFLALGPRLSAASPLAPVREARWLRRDLAADKLPDFEADLVTLSHVLPELPEEERARVLDAAWAACRGVMVVVHAGTSPGFNVIRWTRDRLVRLGAHVLAPCPHAGVCPMSPLDWCHFAQRAERPAVQRRIKHGTLSWEDAKFSFVAVARFESVAVPWGRLVHSPERLKGRVVLPLCSQEGLVERTVAKSAGDVYRAVKDLEWGSAVAKESDLTPA